MREPHAVNCLRGAYARLDELIDERVERLEPFALHMEEDRWDEKGGTRSAPSDGAEALRRWFTGQWPALRQNLASGCLHEGDTTLRVEFIAGLDQSRDYIGAIRNLSDEPRGKGRQWLQGIVDAVVELFYRKEHLAE